VARIALGRLMPRRARRAQNPDGTMTLVEHLYELRSRLTVALIAIAVTTVVGYVWYGVGFFGTPSLGELLKAPYCSIDANSRGVFTTDGSCTLLATGAFDQFTLRLKVAMTVGVVLACPIWLHQVWGFITPGLYAKERRHALTFSSVAAVLFVSGAVLAYWIISQALLFLLTIGDGVQTTALSGDAYFGFLLALLLIFGVSFELPLVVVMLNLAGVVSYEQLARWRRGLIFGLFVFAAIATPGQDPFSMISLAIALVILFEAATQVTRLVDRRRARKRKAEGWDDWDPDAPSPIDTAPSDIDTRPSPIDEPDAVEATAGLDSSPPAGAGREPEGRTRPFDDAT
jgi:sec-independent protein translocase protein TatC